METQSIADAQFLIFTFLPMQSAITFTDFQNVELRCGEIIEAMMNTKARKPAYVLKIDFGETIGVKISSAQITENYSAHDLIGRKIIAVMNFPPKNVAGIVSEVLVLASIDDDNGTLLLSADKKSRNGSRIA